MIGTILGGAGAIGSGIGNIIGQQNQRKREEEIRKKTWEREDNAVQRRAKDMQLAGINPLLAAGDPAQASTGGGTGQATDTSSLGGAMAQTGQIIDQIGIQKKQQVLQEQKQDAEIAKIESETRGQEIENAQGDTRRENTEADTAKKREEARKIEKEVAKVEAEIDAIKENTELTKEKRLSEIQRRLIDSIIEIGDWEVGGGIGAGGIGVSGKRREKIFASVKDIAEQLERGEISTSEAMEKAQEQIEAHMESHGYSEEEKEKIRKMPKDQQKNLMDYREHQGY